MITLIVMAIGILIGLTIFPKKLHKANNLFQPIITVVLIFCMGVALGARENFFDSLGKLGFESLVFCACTIVFSVLFVFGLSKIFLKDKKTDNPDTRREP